MASSLIAGAVSILLIMIAGYVIGSGILAIGETTVLVQTEVTQNQEQLLQTSIAIDAYWDTTKLWVNVTNTGSTTFSSTDFSKMDIYILYFDNTINRHENSFFDTFAVNSTTDIINKGMWDPSEVLEMTKTSISQPKWIKFVTPNGVSASTNV